MTEGFRTTYVTEIHHDYSGRIPSAGFCGTPFVGDLCTVCACVGGVRKQVHEVLLCVHRMFIALGLQWVMSGGRISQS